MSVLNLSELDWTKEFHFVAVVEATDFERYALWQLNRYRDTPYSWKDFQHGIGITIGNGRCGDDRPVVLSLTAARVDGSDILFYHPTSQFVDYVMIDEAIRHSFPTLHKTDATNFSNAVHAGRRLREQRVERVSAATNIISQLLGSTDVKLVGITAELYQAVDTALAKLYAEAQ